MTTEDYVSFETAKLLKEKGFDGKCWEAYTGNNWTYEPPFKNSEFNLDAEKSFFTIPTLQMAMKWLREERKINIERITYWSRQEKTVYGNRIVNIVEIPTVLKEIDIAYDTYEEACETAIKYCLENLV